MLCWLEFTDDEDLPALQVRLRSFCLSMKPNCVSARWVDTGREKLEMIAYPSDDTCPILP